MIKEQNTGIRFPNSKNMRVVVLLLLLGRLFNRDNHGFYWYLPLRLTGRIFPTRFPQSDSDPVYVLVNRLRGCVVVRKNSKITVSVTTG